MRLAIIQARMGSSRLPGKMIEKIGGKSVLRHCIDQVKRSKNMNMVIVATTIDRLDDELVREAKLNQCIVERGSVDDVLDRFYQSAKKHNADIVVRINGDCPFIDPDIIDETLDYYLQHKDKYDYVSNVHPPTFPDGYDVEVLTFGILEQIWKTANMRSQREHVTTAIWEHPERYRIGVYRNTEDLSRYRIVLDEKEDLQMLREIYSKLDSENINLNNVMKVVRNNPHLLEINKKYEREEGYRKSLAEDMKI